MGMAAKWFHLIDESNISDLNPTVICIIED